MVFGGHLENMQIRSIKSHFSTCQHWFFDSAYPNTPDSDLSQIVAENFLMEDLHMHFIGVRDGKIENLKKKAKLTSAIWFSFTQYACTWPPSRCIQSLEIHEASIEAEKYVTGRN